MIKYKALLAAFWGYRRQYHRVQFDKVAYEKTGDKKIELTRKGRKIVIVQYNTLYSCTDETMLRVVRKSAGKAGPVNQPILTNDRLGGF